MIPKIIHYCWFGGNSLPADAQKCIASWRKFFPDYEIKEWNETNFDVNDLPYTAEAYAEKKYAFVSDFARFKVLYDEGGLYFDTDVEVIKDMTDIVEKGAFMGMELDYETTGECVVAPGLCIGALPGMDSFRAIIDYYSEHHFLTEDGTHNTTDAVVAITTRELKKRGLKDQSGIQVVDGITIYPAEYFNPFDDATGKLNITSNTRSIHWYSKTWMKVNPWRQRLSRLSHRILGSTLPGKIKRFLKR